MPATNHDVVQIDQMLADLMGDFMQRRRDEFPVMEKLYAEKNASELAKFGHKLKGAGLNFGFMKLGQLASQMEEKALKGDIAGIRPIIDDIKSHIENLEITYVDTDE